MRPETEEWVFACARLPHEQVRPFNEDDMIARLHRTLKIPGLEVELMSLSHWQVNAKVASQYRSRGGRIFLVGDAAHRIPPWGALGLNSGIQDADNLIWKLALALKSGKGKLEGLLDGYDSERRPIGERVGKTSLYNMQAHALVLDQAIGLTPEQSEGTNVQAMEQYFDPSDNGKGQAKRQEVNKAMNVLDVEFYAHGAEVGWFYDLDYIGDYGLVESQEANPQLREDGEMELCVYRPSTKPGSQLPHAWLVERVQQRRISTRELLEKSRLVLLAQSAGWKRLDHSFVHVIVVNENDGEFMDEEGRWKEICGVLADTGALLVRPDSIIAYRFFDDDILKDQDPSAQMSNVVEKVLRVKL